jgi:hypothetical protein
MGIKGFKARKDAIGFPVVEWSESRKGHLFSVKVTCSISRDKRTGALLFVTDGSTQKDELYRQRHWDKLLHFGYKSARELYYTAAQLRKLERRKKSWAEPIKRVTLDDDDREKVEYVPNKFGEFIANRLDDDATIVLAEFGDENSTISMHLNYGIGSLKEVAELHNLLTLEFLRKRQAYVDTLCGGAFLWPKS